jgi:Domain of unknown function (DUF4270)
MYMNSFFKTLLFLALTLSLGSCDKDFNTIGDDLVENNHFGLVSQDYNVIAYTQKTGAVQTDNLPVTPFGIYNDSNFGETTASFATQIVLPSEGIVLGTNPTIDSVAVSIPYFIDATKTTANTESGSYKYELDSVYGKPKAKMKLSVYESGFYVRDLDPTNNFQNSQKYYSDQSEFESKKGDLLNDDSRRNNTDNTNFSFKRTEHVINTPDASGNPVYTRTSPEMELRLSNNFFQTKILNNPSKILTNDVFKDYFRGLYFKIEKTDPEGELTMLDLTKGKITLYYKNGPDAARVKQTMVLGFGKKVSLLNTENNTTNSVYASLPDKGDKLAGDPKLYLKGGNGAMAVISLFNNPGELQALKDAKAKINEANLIFNIDTVAINKRSEPNRVYLYDLNNNRPIADYSRDGSNVTGFPKKGKSVYNGIIKRIAKDGKGVSYKINVTNHIRNLIASDSLISKINVKLGLVVTEDINNTANSYWKTRMKLDGEAHFIHLPTASVMNPLGTVLFGSNIKFGEPNYDKRLKLQIYYTKPN